MRRDGAALALRRCSALALLAGCGSGGGGGSDARRAAQPAKAPSRRSSSRPPSSGFDAAKVYREASPGVVTIRSIFDGTARAEGSGFVLDTDGEIVTNAHVVTDDIERRRASRPRRSSSSSPTATSSRPKIVGFDPFADVALLEGRTRRLRPAPAEARRRRATSQVGQPVAAIGSPFGEQQSLSVGIVSATDRSVEIADPVPDRGRDPDRRLDQPRQLRRPAARRRRPRGRHQPADRDQLRRQRRRRLRGADLGDQALGRPARRKTATPNTPTSASPARRSTRSSPQSSASTPTFGGLLAEVVPGGPADEGRARGRRREAPLPGRPNTGPAAT